MDQSQSIQLELVVDETKFNEDRVLKENLIACLEYCRPQGRGYLNQAAKLLGINRKSLYRRKITHGL